MSKEIDWGGAINPVGTIINYLGTIAPDGYLFCDGTEYNIADYPALAHHFETNFGTKNYFGGDGTTTFKVPNLQGEFLRCTGTNSHVNNGNGASVGTHQDGTLDGFTYTGGNAVSMLSFVPKDTDYVSTSGYTRTISNKVSTDSNGIHVFRGRPTNTSVWYCIKF
jgi:microcystin-dependent protein